MVVLDNLKEFTKPAAVALGRFDGVHRGHKKVIYSAVDNKKGLTSCVLTFSYDRQIADRFCLAPYIMPDTQKIKHIEKLGAQTLIFLPFADFCNLSPRDFVKEVLHNKLKAKLVCCGYNYRFGKGAAADTLDLRRLCNELGIELIVTPAVCESGRAISSTRIRRLIESGDVAEANRLLGHQFCIDFEVEKGAGRGRTLGIPTINQAMRQGFVIPKFGVYASKVQIGEKRYDGVTNIGVRPTVGDFHDVKAETWIEGFEGDLYGQRVEVFLYEFIRDEKKFESLELLKQQVACDWQKAKEILEKYK